MKILKFLLLVVLLNVARYLIGGSIEAVTIMEPMHAIMPQFPEVFDNDFSSSDFALSFFYNFVMWLTATLLFHLTWPVFKGNFIAKSFKVFGLMGLFFISLTAIYLNHYNQSVKLFYFYAILDAVIIFPVVALTNGLLYPRMFKKEIAAHSS